MAWRFRKRVKLIPGIYLNLSKSGISTTIGPRGLSVNIGPNGVFLNSGIPGTGLYNRIPLHGDSTNSPDPGNTKEIAEKLKYLLEQIYDGTEQIKSAVAGELTSSGLQYLKETIIAAHTEYAEISTIIQERNALKYTKDRKLNKLRKSLFKFLFKKRIERLGLESGELQEELEELNEQLDLSSVNLQINNDDSFAGLYTTVEKAYELISSCSKIWDITASKDINRIQARSFADTEVKRVEVKAMLAHSGLIVTDKMPLRLLNKNGGDLYFYPGFVIVHEQVLDFAILDYSEFDIEFVSTQFVESETVPLDTAITGNTWAKVNKDGSPDRRFNNNYSIPLARYGQITFSSTTGLKERYLFSNHDYSNLFYKAIREYIAAIKMANALLKQFK